jgi:hypothetical protein
VALGPPTDATRLTSLPLDDRQPARAEARSAALADLGLTRADAALFTVLHYGQTTAPEFLPGRAAAEDYNPLGPTVTEEECRVALAGCLARGWLRVIDEPARASIFRELRAGGYTGPVYQGGGPDVGCVDFTDAGLALWRRLCELTRPDQDTPAVYTDVVREHTARFFRTASAATAAIAEIRKQEDVVAVAGPTPTGPWRAQWWRRFPEGYRIDVEKRRRWQGLGSGGGEDCYFNHSARKADPGKLRSVLDRHNVTLPEWLVLEGMERPWFRDSADNLCAGVAETGERLLGVTISPDTCLEGLDACLRHGWLRVVDHRAVAEVRSLLAADTALPALPRTAEGRPQECCYEVDPRWPGRLRPVPLPDTDWLGRIDFTPAGAALYRTTAAEWLGPDWEDALVVARGYFWEEHHYCETETDEGFDHIIQEHVAKGDVVRNSRVVPIGPWCVSWWERFAAGYRLELELGEP